MLSPAPRPGHLRLQDHARAGEGSDPLLILSRPGYLIARGCMAAIIFLAFDRDNPGACWRLQHELPHELEASA